MLKKQIINNIDMIQIKDKNKYNAIYIIYITNRYI